MKILTVITAIFLAAINFVGAQTTGTNAISSPPREGDNVPAPGPRDRAYGISGPGAKHTAAWTNYNRQATGAAVTNGLIPNLKPLIPDTQLRDTIVILGGDGNYYMTGSSGADIWDFNDGIELWRSSDLKKWNHIGEVWSFDKDGTWEKNWRWHRKPVRAIWAPEIHYIKRLNNYFITISMPPGNRGILKSTTGKPEGPYVNALANDGYFKGGIDATLFEDDDGKVYFTSGGASTILLMNDDLSGFDGESHRIEFERPVDGSWTRNSIAQEGASLFKRNGVYYLGGAGFHKGRYSSVVAMSTNIFGPYKNWEEAVPCGGGTDYFQDKDGNWWDAYFGNDNQSPFREKPAIVKIDFDQDGKIFVAKNQPDFALVPPAPVILTPPAPAVPRINGPKIFGVRPEHPFLFIIPATGERPMTFAADNLPAGLVLDPKTGIITGSVKERGNYSVTLHAANHLGSAARNFRIVVGDQIALTPPMGWNTYYGFRLNISDPLIREEADAMVRSGLAQHGWNYINLDEGWTINPASKNPLLNGAPREVDGRIRLNERFPDMKALCDYVHAQGLKIGLYSSPGPLDCGGFVGSYQHEEQDAQTYADWGFDYLKYDWCSYKGIAKDSSLPEARKPYDLMVRALRRTGRDIVFSLCQYGLANSWEWAADAGGNCWRTTRDIIDKWETVSDRGFSQAGLEKFAGPGHWNDPDMLVVGVMVRNLPSRLTPDEQYTHISLWCLLDAPLIIGGDLRKLDDFTFGLLSNDEVLEVNQDPLGLQAARVSQDTTRNVEVWAKDMKDGSKAVGLFNRGEKSQPVAVNWSELGLRGSQTVRDLWRQKDLGMFNDKFEAPVNSHGVVLVRIFPNP